jgi:hypothetical protein
MVESSTIALKRSAASHLQHIIGIAFKKSSFSSLPPVGEQTFWKTELTSNLQQLKLAKSGGK